MPKEKQKTKLCKYCKTEIPYGAKVCPNCRKKQGGILKWIILIILVIGIIGAASGSGEDEKPKKVNNSTEPTTSKNSAATEENTKGEEKFLIGETAEMNNIQVTMTDYRESEGSDFNKPSDGNVFVLVEFEIANNSDSELTVSSLISFEAYVDDYSTSISLGALIEKDGNQLDGTVAAGKKLKGWIGYEVAKDWKTIEIRFADSVWSNNKFIFEIEKE